MLIKSEEFWQLFIVHADVKRLSASDLVSAVGLCARRQFHRTECLTTPWPVGLLFVLIGTARNTAVTSSLTHIILHLQHSSTTCQQYLLCAFQHIYTASTIWPYLSSWCYCVTVKRKNILIWSLMKKKIGILCIYCGCNSQGSLSVEHWRVLAEWAGVKLDLVEVVTLSVIKDLEKVTHGKSWEFTFELWRLQ